MIRQNVIFLAFAVALVLISSCGTAKISLSPRFSPYLLEFTENTYQLSKEDLIRQKDGDVLIYPLLSEDREFKHLKEYDDAVIRFVREAGLYKTVRLLEDIEPEFDVELRKLHSAYLDTFRFSHLSDLAFTKELRDRFGVKSILFFQVDAWPCETCLNTTYIRMNLTLVDTFTGNVVWFIMDEDLNAEAADADEAGVDIRNRILYTFYREFKDLDHLLYRKALKNKGAL